jgi:hypothetical protein
MVSDNLNSGHFGYTQMIFHLYIYLRDEMKGIFICKNSQKKIGDVIIRGILSYLF